jgi:hypothetical protein
MKKLIILFSAILLLSQSSFAGAINAGVNQEMEGIWALQGTSSSMGPYSGELELRKVGGVYNVIRKITYLNKAFDGLKVQEIWTGEARADEKALAIRYALKQGAFITKLNGKGRSASDFKNSASVEEYFIPFKNGLSAQFTDKNNSIHREFITPSRDLELSPLWVNRRTYLDAKGPGIPLLIRGVIKAFKAKIGYEKDPIVKSYKNRNEFIYERSSIVFDPTDFEFYRQNKDIVRVVNKITDDISMTEALIKRNAYAPSLGEKQQGYERNTVTNHINEQGMVSFASIDGQGHFIRYEVDGDSALWTGMYVGSQAMRYLLTHDAEALNNIKKSLKGLFALMDITGDNKEFARTLATYIPGQPLPEKWHQGKGRFQDIMWLEGGNNDMVKGLAHAFLWASLVIPEEERAIWLHLKEKSLRLIKLRVVDEKIQNRTMALGLAALINKDSKLQREYANSFLKPSVMITGYYFDYSYYWHGTADWSGVNLGMVGDITKIIIADRLGELKIRDTLRERLMDAWVVYAPARRSLLTMAAYGFAYSQGARGHKFRVESSNEKFRSALSHAVWGLREIPYPRPNLDVEFDHSLNPEWCMSPIPRMFWKAANSPMPPIDFFYQGLYGYPVFEGDAFISNFIWKDGAFEYKGARGKGVEFAGVDYLYAYWLGRYARVPNLN